MKTMKRLTLSFVITAAIVIVSMAGYTSAAHAEDGYSYIERSWNGSEVALDVKTRYAYTSLDSTSLTDNWYVAYQDREFNSRKE